MLGTGHGRGAVGVTGRLLALVMIPVTVMCAFATSRVTTLRATARDANAIDRGVDKLDRACRAACRNRGSAIRAGVLRTHRRARLQPGIGRHPHGRRPRRRRAFGTSRASITHSACSARPLPSAEPTFRSCTQKSTATGLHRWTSIGAISRIEYSIRSAITARVQALGSQADRTHAASLGATLRSFRVADVFVKVATPQGIDVSAVWFPASAATAQANRAAIARLAAASAGYASVSQQLRELAVPEVVASLDRIDHDPRVHAFEAAVASALRGEPFVNPRSGDDVAAAAGMALGGYLVRIPLLDGLIKTATVAVRDRARDLAAADRQAFMAWATLALLLAALSLGVALAFGHSISRPLKRAGGLRACRQRRPTRRRILAMDDSRAA